MTARPSPGCRTSSRDQIQQHATIKNEQVSGGVEGYAARSPDQGKSCPTLGRRATTHRRRSDRRLTSLGYMFAGGFARGVVCARGGRATHRKARAGAGCRARGSGPDGGSSLRPRPRPGQVGLVRALLRTTKPSSPMSLGFRLLMAYGPQVSMAASVPLTELVYRVGRAGTLGAGRGQAEGRGPRRVADGRKRPCPCGTRPPRAGVRVHRVRGKRGGRADRAGSRRPRPLGGRRWRGVIWNWRRCAR